MGVEFRDFESGPPSRNPDYTGRVGESWRRVLSGVVGIPGAGVSLSVEVCESLKDETPPRIDVVLWKIERFASASRSAQKKRRTHWFSAWAMRRTIWRGICRGCLFPFWEPRSSSHPRG